MTADSVSIAENVIRADGHPFTTLSLAPGGPPVTGTTDVSEARRSYMKIASLIHPDKLKNSYARATEAFQCLVRAFECFADPKKRQAVARAEQRKGTTAPGKRCRSAFKQLPPKAKNTKTGTGARAASKPKRTRKRADSSDFEREDTSSSSESRDDEALDSDGDVEGWDAFLFADQPPEVSTSRKPIGEPRTGGIYKETLVGCPQCGSKWEPDSKPQYSLFMGKWGRKAHCQLCLCRFGSATARHSCPYCESPFTYDSSMYDNPYQCKGKCKKTIGFPYYPVNQSLIDQMALEEWKLQKEKERRAERDRRAAARVSGKDPHLGAATVDTRLQLAVGTCVMDSECPICGKKVVSKHRAHVEQCLKKNK